MSLFKNRKKKRLIRKLFGQYLRDEELETIVSGSGFTDLAERSEEPISFLIAHVEDEVLEEVPALVGEATEVIIDHGGLVTSRFSSFLTAIFQPNREVADQLQCVEAARQLVDRLGVKVRVVYGRAIGFVTVLGANGSKSYGPVLPRALELLSELGATKPGEAREISC